MSDVNDSVFICGPTACGKTAAAIALAVKINGEIISADSRQVFRGMDIGTGKDLADYAASGVPCHLVDVAEPCDSFSLHDYLEKFKDAFASVSRAGKMPVVCGGTGLYVEAVLRGYDLSGVGEDPAFRDEMMLLSSEDIVERLRAFPAHFAAADFSSKKRLVRSLEKAVRGGDPGGISEPVVKRPIVFACFYPREMLKKRIDERLDARLEAGMVDEVNALIARGVSGERIDSFGMEYRRILEFITGKISFDEMREMLRVDIHRLAKRQMTWFRGMERRGIHLHWIDFSETEPVSFMLSKINFSGA